MFGNLQRFGRQQDAFASGRQECVDGTCIVCGFLEGEPDISWEGVTAFTNQTRGSKMCCDSCKRGARWQYNTQCVKTIVETIEVSMSSRLQFIERVLFSIASKSEKGNQIGVSQRYLALVVKAAVKTPELLRHCLPKSTSIPACGHTMTMQCYLDKYKSGPLANGDNSQRGLDCHVWVPGLNTGGVPKFPFEPFVADGFAKHEQDDVLRTLAKIGTDRPEIAQALCMFVFWNNDLRLRQHLSTIASRCILHCFISVPPKPHQPSPTLASSRHTSPACVFVLRRFR